MIIKLPMKYSVLFASGIVFLEVPPEYTDRMVYILKKQPWVKSVYSDGSVQIFLSNMLVATEEEIKDALFLLCEYVCDPAPELDEEVWKL